MKHNSKDLDRTILIEATSAISFILTACIFVSDNITSPVRIHEYFWVIMFFVFGFLQSSAVVFRYDLILLRICMTWVAGSVWSWLTYTSYSHPLHIVALIVGLFNMYAFVFLTNRINIDWSKFYREE